MRVSAWTTSMCLLALACASGESDSGADAIYGPCDACDSAGPTLQSSDGTCICALFCHVGEEPCPQPLTGDVEAICVDQGDVVSNGYDGRCDLPCSAGATCPDDSECSNGFCRYRGDFNESDMSSK